MFQRILVPVDFAPCSARAARLALKLAQRLGSKVKLLHVWRPPDFAGADLLVLAHSRSKSIGELARDEAAAALTQLVAQLGADASVETEVVIGDPRREILRIAKRDGCELIVMGTHGRTGASRLLSGSVTDAVVRRARVPVLTVRGD